MPENTGFNVKSMPDTPATAPFCFLNVFKPKGITSFDVIYKLRKRLGIKKIGHSGTLDPLAEGVMQVAVGRATRLIDFLGSDKKYIARIKFGFLSSTGDAEGEITPANVPNFEYEQLLNAINSLTGEIEQIPPVYSAIKVGGKKLCNLARKGKLHQGHISPSQNPETPSYDLLNTNSVQNLSQNNVLNPDISQNLLPQSSEIIDIKVPARKITIYEAKILKCFYGCINDESLSCSDNQTYIQNENPIKFISEKKHITEIDIEISCSKGTYIRSYAVDLAARLGTGAYLTALTRIQAGNFTVNNAVNIDEVCLARDAINPAAALDLPKYFLDEKEYARVLNGMPVLLHSGALDDLLNKNPNDASAAKILPSYILLIFNETLVSIGILEDNKIVCKKVFL